MVPAPIAVSNTALTAERKSALLVLLADEDPAVHRKVRAKILSYGGEVKGWLRTHVLDDNPVLRRRVLEILNHLARRTADARFLDFCQNHGEELDVEAGAWLLAQTQYPDINIAAYQAMLDSFAGELRERINPDWEAEKLLTIINQYLFGELGFTGNEQAYYEPENSYLNRVIDRRTGNPINLCLVYLALARRLRLPVCGIGLPGHFLCRHQTARREIYIDVFNCGKLLSKADCVQYLLHSNFGLHEGYLTAITTRRLLMRICGNLHQIYRQLQLADETARLESYLVALAR